MYSEAKRVLQFQNVCHTMPDDALYQLGALMNESHESCSTFYQCSHPDVDWLVQTCRYVKHCIFEILLCDYWLVINNDMCVSFKSLTVL